MLTKSQINFYKNTMILALVLVQLPSCPLPGFSGPVRLTPYNSLKVFDISKHTGPGLADAVGLKPQRQLLYWAALSLGEVGAALKKGCHLVALTVTVQLLPVIPALIMRGFTVHESHCVQQS